MRAFTSCFCESFLPLVRCWERLRPCGSGPGPGEVHKYLVGLGRHRSPASLGINGIVWGTCVCIQVKELAFFRGHREGSQTFLLPCEVASNPLTINVQITQQSQGGTWFSSCVGEGLEREMWECEKPGFCRSTQVLI